MFYFEASTSIDITRNVWKFCRSLTRLPTDNCMGIRITVYPMGHSLHICFIVTQDEIKLFWALFCILFICQTFYLGALLKDRVCDKFTSKYFQISVLIPYLIVKLLSLEFLLKIRKHDVWIFWMFSKFLRCFVETVDSSRCYLVTVTFLWFPLCCFKKQDTSQRNTNTRSFFVFSTSVDNISLLVTVIYIEYSINICT